MTLTSLVAVQSHIHPGPNLPGQVTGYYPYVVSVESALYGQINVPGVVTVGEQSTDQTSDSNNIAQSRGEAGRIDGQPTDEKRGPASSTSTTTTTTTTPAM
jgi:hypothetical protein